jgi:hypothetical protein
MRFVRTLAGSSARQVCLELQPGGRMGLVDNLGDLRRSGTPVAAEDNDDALILWQRGEHVRKTTRVTGQACGRF